MDNTKETKNDNELVEKLIEMLDKHQIETTKTQRQTMWVKVGFLLYLFLGTSLILGPSLYQFIDDSLPHEKVVVAQLYGEVSADNINESYIDRALSDARKNNATGLILEINSPGGSPVQAHRIYKKIVQFKKDTGIEVIALVDDVAASAGYLIACSADKIYADEFSLVGSIGVIYRSFGFSTAMKKIGIERRTYTAGKYKAFLDPFSEEVSFEADHMKQLLHNSHNVFKKVVNNARVSEISDDPQIFSGLIWTGEKANELGLIDGYKSKTDILRDHFDNAETVTTTKNGFSISRLLKVSANWLGSL